MECSLTPQEEAKMMKQRRDVKVIKRAGKKKSERRKMKKEEKAEVERQ